MVSASRSSLGWAPALTVAVMVGPIAFGLMGTVLPALGYRLGLVGDAEAPPFSDLFAQPGLWLSVWRSLSIGIVATLHSLVLAVSFLATFHETRAGAIGQRLISPLLSVPHVSLAIGLAFLIAPSGWIARATSPWLTGWERPPDLLIIHDPHGLSLILTLVIKETPFLLLMLLSAMRRVPVDRTLTLCRAMGYRAMTAWLKAVLPQLYGRMRLPILAVLVFSTSVVDLAILVGPGTPAPLGVRVLRWMNDPDLSMRAVGSAGAVLQISVSLSAVAIWLLGEWMVRRLARRWVEAGGRGRGETIVRACVAAVASLTGLLAIGALAMLVVWSLAGPWRFPDVLPSGMSLSGWRLDSQTLVDALISTTILALLSAGAALILVVACLEHETRSGRRPSPAVEALIYTPLIVPQVSFLFGFQLMLVMGRAEGTWAAVVWSHLIFVLPYVFLSLVGPWRRFDPRYRQVALTLGRSENEVLRRVTLAMLFRAVSTAFAVGVAVSVSLYLPTVFAGAGRVTTLTTEAVALSAGGDRRVVAALALLQVVLPLLAFLAVNVGSRDHPVSATSGSRGA